MAQKKQKQRTQRSYTKTDVIRALSFIGIFLSALLFLIGAILNVCGLGSVVGILNLIAQLSLLVAVAFPAWDFIKTKGKAWRVIYWIALVIYIVGCVFGLVTIYVKF